MAAAGGGGRARNRVPARARAGNRPALHHMDGNAAAGDNRSSFAGHACRRAGIRYPRRAASIVAISILRISIMASTASLAAARSRPVQDSVRARGDILHERPTLFLKHPLALSLPPLAKIVFHSRSVLANTWLTGCL